MYDTCIDRSRRRVDGCDVLSLWDVKKGNIDAYGAGEGGDAQFCWGWNRRVGGLGSDGDVDTARLGGYTEEVEKRVGSCEGMGVCGDVLLSLGVLDRWRENSSAAAEPEGEEVCDGRGPFPLMVLGRIGGLHVRCSARNTRARLVV